MTEKIISEFDTLNLNARVLAHLSEVPDPNDVHWRHAFRLTVRKIDLLTNKIMLKYKIDYE